MLCGRPRVLDGEQHFSTDSSNFLPRIKDGVDTVGEPIFSTVDALYGTMTLPRAGVLWPLTFDTTNGEGTFGEYRPTFLRGGVQKAPAGAVHSPFPISYIVRAIPFVTWKIGTCTQFNSHFVT